MLMQTTGAEIAPSLSHSGFRSYYQTLLGGGPAAASLQPWFAERVRETAPDADLPEDPAQLFAWVDQQAEETGAKYSAYLERRNAGGQREMFANRSAALNFIRLSGPTKLVDGSWLYSALQRWPDVRLHPLIRTYIDELGEGDERYNHVSLYKKLLRQFAINDLDKVEDAHYEQGALQLGFARFGAEFVPEMIGFNFGYEQPPAHLSISAYELNELGIDPFYFVLHVSADNAAAGHARMAAQALLDMLPADAHRRARFYERVRRGFAMSNAGIGAMQIAQQFDLDEEMVRLLADKAQYGQRAHSDYCRIGGKHVNEWLSTPSEIPAFLDAMVAQKWIMKGRDPEESRFWNLINGPRAEMLGVFTPYEMQVIYDWISQGCEDYLSGPKHPALGRMQAASGKHLSFRAAARRAAPDDALANNAQFGDHKSGVRGDDADEAFLQMKLSTCVSKFNRLEMLIKYLDPAVHDSPIGLAAAQCFSRELN